MNSQEMEAKRKKTERIVKVAAIAVVGFFVAPFTLIAIEGVLGMIVLGAIITGASFVTPVIARKVANWRLKVIKAEAAKNPIETLENDYGKQQQQLATFRDKLTTFDAEIGNFANKLAKFHKQYSAEEAAVFDQQLAKMKQLFQLRTRNFQEATRKLDQYSLEIKKATAIWNMGQAAAAMTKAAGMTEDDFFDKISRETALDSVELSLNKAFADLDLSFAEETATRPDETALQQQRNITVEKV